MGATTSELAQYEDEGPAVTEDRILRILSELEKTTDIVVQDVIVRNGKDDNDDHNAFMFDVMVTANVKTEHKVYHWMIKSTPRNPKRWVTSRLRLQTDEKEVKFYRDLLPRLKTFALNKNKEHLLPNFCSVPFCEWSSIDKVLVMDNLRTHGFRNATNGRTGLDATHVTLAIKWLARFHALGYSVIDQYNGGIEQMQTDNLDIFFWKWSDTPNFVKFNRQCNEIYGWNNQRQLKTMKEIDKLVGKNTAYYASLHYRMLDKFKSRHSLETLFEAGIATRDHVPFRVKTFIHGNTYFENQMYKYNDGGLPRIETPSDVVFIDFQFNAYASPAIDLVEFLYSSVTKGVGIRWEDILRAYHEEFTDTVFQLGSSLNYSFEDLITDYNKACFYGLNILMNPLRHYLINEEELSVAMYHLRIKDVIDDLIKNELI